ncbi:formate--tetrahydrofolate ligase [Porphyromonas sp. oral taxon 279 str. F0450]|uniref:formate--tetrahydrofolate ligase n=1 Tax=Porphyromonas sp. oral taxon 279 TaxID=712438 RepID=UPI00027C364F|nr:formate--tetrahydrofolate ligase [Porphyromonas sp. oral taxon 279]EJU16320.1 formate--tetrahydrofolate ligase [Porphyromonas sp. oral taxon 279 str. F0450]
MKTDIEIARSIALEPIEKIAAKVAIPTDHLEHYGKYLAKVDLSELQAGHKPGKLILVTAITATKAGIGKTTVSIGLALGMNRLGHKAVVALREPSLGPCFGMKGGAAGGGYAQVLPMEKINLHFTGDFHAITSAHNMITALLDNYIYQNRNTDKGLSEVLWKRVLDVNDRSLRSIVTGLGGQVNGIPAESGFDITPASEIMAILCLSTSLEDLRRRIESILLGYTKQGEPFTVRDLGVAGAITVLLLDAIKPNLAQTTEHTPAFIHGGPFANIAHGCNSILATRMALAHSDYTITEAGFGADLGAEKFYNIKCRTAGLQPALTVLVATLGGLKMHGGVDEKDLKTQNIEGVRHGLANLDRHIENLKSFGQTVIVAFNRFATDTEEEIALVREHCHAAGVGFAVNTAFGEGGAGAEELARLVVETIEQKPSQPLQFTYPLTASIEEKATAIAQRIYGARSIHFSAKAQRQLERIERHGWSKFPVCIAKTQYSFSDDPTAYGSVRDFDLEVRDVVINTGAEMIVLVLGALVRMPGLPRVPQAEKIDFVDGHIEGLS